MPFNFVATLKEMGQVAGRILGDKVPEVRECVRRALAEEKAFLEKLATARLAGEIDDDILARQLEDEKQTLEATLLVCQVMTKVMAQAAANAAIDVFNNAIKVALAPLIGVARTPVGRGRRAAVRRVAAGSSKPVTLAQRRLNARRDGVDFRDLLYTPTLVEVPRSRSITAYLKVGVPVLDQGEEGACTGFGLATVAHFLLRTLNATPDRAAVSPRMFYAMARRYDEWNGEAYDGSSCRGAVKGWHKHGVCLEQLWRHDPAVPDYVLNDGRARDAQNRPMGAYFRVNHKDLVAMHAAITEAGILYASSDVHAGWDGVPKSGMIPYTPGDGSIGGHAFAIVAYDEKGFWIQNSWGKTWGRAGMGHVSYEDWLRNGTDVWVARLGVPVDLATRQTATVTSYVASSRARAMASTELRPHIVSLGNEGRLRPGGNNGTTPSEVRQIFQHDLPRLTSNWPKKRLILYAHGGLVSEDSAIQRISDYRETMLKAHCYPLAFIWHSDYWTTITNMLEDALRLRKSEAPIESVRDFMLDRIDDALEPIARKVTGKAAWDEMKENAIAATQSPSGGARVVASELAGLIQGGEKLEIHLVGHSAGSILLAPLFRLLTGASQNLFIKSCTLWAPACTMALFESHYAPALQSGQLEHMNLFTLSDKCELDDHCARIYNKSLLYLVSNAFERRPRVPIFRPEGESILGMAKFLNSNTTAKSLIKSGKLDWIVAPNSLPVGDAGASGSISHGGFEDDEATVAATMARILGTKLGGTKAGESLSFKPGVQKSQGCRKGLSSLQISR